MHRKSRAHGIRAGRDDHFLTERQRLKDILVQPYVAERAYCVEVLQLAKCIDHQALHGIGKAPAIAKTSCSIRSG